MPRLCIFLILLLPVAVAAASQQPSGSPKPAISDSWKQIRTPDLIVAGNARTAVLQDILRELTRFRATLASLLPEVTTSGHAPTWVVVLKDDRAFTRFLPLDSRGRRRSNVGAYFMSREHANYMVLEGSGRELDLETVFHEYTHYLVSRNVRVNMPMWLSEGLAEFYSTFRGDFRGRTMLGAIPSTARVISSATFVPLREIVMPRDVEETWRWSTRINMFYAEAWALVHYIVVERKNPVPNAVGTYLSTLARTGSNDAAFKEAFGTDIEGMDRELREYVRRVSLDAIVINAQVDLSSKLDAQPMLEADVSALAGTLLFELGSLQEAERELAAAAKREPANAPMAVALARVRIEQDREAEAISLLEDVIGRAPGDGLAHYHLGQALAKVWRHDEALASFQRAIDLMPASPFPWARSSAAWLALERDTQAAAALSRAYQIEPLPSHYWAHGIAALRLGRNDVAAASLTTYLEQRGGGEDVSVYPLFVQAIANWRANRPADAEAALAKAEKASNQEKWTVTVLRYLQGRMDADQFLRSASTVGERTEANTYIGFKLALAGRQDEAEARYKWVVEQGSKNYLEYVLARNELERIKHGRLQAASSAAP